MKKQNEKSGEKIIKINLPIAEQVVSMGKVSTVTLGWGCRKTEGRRFRDYS